MNIAILWPSFGPYHVARLNALRALLNERGHKLIAYRFAAQSGTYGWQPETPPEIEVITLVETADDVGAHPVHLSWRFYRSLREKDVKVVFLPSYSPLANCACLFAAKLARCRAVLMTESWSRTERPGMWRRIVKRVLVSLFDSALVGGAPHAQYISGLGMRAERIMRGYDSVDVKYFSERADVWRHRAHREIPFPGLPERYFLNLGRFVEKKNMFMLIDAYSKLRERGIDKIPLVLVGEGELQRALEQYAKKCSLRVYSGSTLSSPPEGGAVIFFPFQQYEYTPLFFSRCDAFILPSIEEEWGLVVNEAMACGAPVIVSRNAGCAADLVQDGKNGYVFDPCDAQALSEILEKFIDDPESRTRMGSFSREIIEGWGLERFATAGAQAFEACL